jgi:hypothetical protein
MIEKPSRAAALTVILDANFATRVRCSLLKEFEKIPPVADELRQLLVPAKIVQEPSQEVRLKILGAILGTTDPKLQREIVSGLKGLLLKPSVAADLKRSLTASISENAPDAVQGLMLLANNPSILAADIDRDRLVATRARQIRTLLKELPLVRECVAMVAQDPSAGRALRSILSRRGEFIFTSNGELKSPEPGFQATRFVTPIFSALSRTQLGRDLLGATIEEVNTRYSGLLWTRIKAQKGILLPEIVLGSGPSAVNYRSTRLMLDPNYQGVVIDAAPFGGGQFASSLEAVFKLNSRSRPLGTVSRENLPGTESPLNTLGPYCAIQESDLGSEVYGPQVNLGLAIQLNHLLAGGVLCGIELTRWNRLSDASEKPRYVVELKNVATGETAIVETERIVSARGLGNPRVSVDTNDPVTAEILEEQKKFFVLGERPQYVLFPNYCTLVGNRLDSDPLRGIRRAIVIGAGDSGNVVVESLLGYGPATGLAPLELDCLESVVWLGQDISTKESFERCSRNRYAQLANDFPRKTNRAAAYRIEPIKKKAVRLARSPEGRIQVIDSKGARHEGDIIVDCGGFTLPDLLSLRDSALSLQGSSSKRRKALSSEAMRVDKKKLPSDAQLQRESLSKSQLSTLKLCLEGLSQRIPSKDLMAPVKQALAAIETGLEGWQVVKGKPSRLEKLKASSWIVVPSNPGRGSEWYVRSGSLITALVQDPALSRTIASSPTAIFSKEPLSIGESLYRYSRFDAATRSQFILLVPPKVRLTSKGDKSEAPPRTRSRALPPGYSQVKSTLNGEEVPVASQLTGEEIFVVGPESRICFSAAERRKLQLNFIAENVVAVFLYSSRITTFAEDLTSSTKDDYQPNKLMLPTATDLRAPFTGRSSTRRADSWELVMQQSSESSGTGRSSRSRVVGLQTDHEKVVELFLRDAFRGINVAPDAEPLLVTLSRRIVSGQELIEIASSQRPLCNLEPSEVLKRACSLLLTSPVFRPRSEMNSITYEIPPRVSERSGKTVPLDWAKMRRVEIRSSAPGKRTQDETDRRSSGRTKPKGRSQRAGQVRGKGKPGR